MSSRELEEQKAQLDRWEVEEGFPDDDERVDQIGPLHHSEASLAPSYCDGSSEFSMFGGSN